MSYFESRLRLNLEDLDEVHRTLKFCEKLNIENLILEPVNNSKHFHDKIFRRIRDKTKINIYYRNNLKPRTLYDFKKELKRLTSFPFILSIETPNKKIQIQAAKDSRVDILSFSDENLIRTVSEGVISLIKQNNSFIEFSLAPILINRKTMQSKNFRNLYRLVKLLLKLKVNYIISGNFKELYHLRNPRNLVSVCHTLLGMSLEDAKKGFQENINLLLDRVDQRINKNQIEKGVRLIKGGDNAS